MNLHCIIVTEPIRQLAKALGIDANTAAVDIGMWQTQNNTTTMPAVEDIKDLRESLQRQKQYESTVQKFMKNIKVMTYEGYWTRAEVEKAKDKVFLFGDNTNDRIHTHYAPTSTQAVIRGLSNAIGIDTKKDRGTKESSYFTDADFDVFKAQVDEAIAKAKASGKTIVVHKDIGKGKAELDKRAPKLYEYLRSALNNLFVEAKNMEEKEIKETPYTPESINWVPTIPDINLDAIDENLMRLAGAFTPQQLFRRISNIAYHFSDALDILYDRKIQETKAALNETNSKNVERVLELSKILSDITDSKNGKDNFVKDYLNIADALDETKKSLIRRIAITKDKLKGNVSDESLNYQMDQYQKMYDNFDLLLIQATNEIEANEGIRISISQSKTATKAKDLVGDKVVDTEDLEGDNDTERVVSGNSGWVIKARKVDPHESITQGVRRILKNIQQPGDKAFDDLGYPQFLDFEYAYATILNGCSYMIDSNDFDVFKRNADGSLKMNAKGKPVRSLPALEKLAEKYEWVNQVIRHLKANPSLIPSFYTCFRMDYIPYYMLYEGKLSKVNEEMHTANTIEAILRNYERGNTLHKDSIYIASGEINLKAAETGKALADQLINDLHNQDFYEGSYDDLNTILKMIGIEIEGDLKGFLNIFSDNTDLNSLNVLSIDKILLRAKDIFQRLSEVKPGEHLIDHFNQDYSEIAQTIGSVSATNRHMTFRQGESDYPSYSTPNKITTLFKQLLSPDTSRRQGILNFYKQSEWFYNEKLGWKNFMLEQFENNEALVEELRDGALANINTMGNADLFGSKYTEYSKWNEDQIHHLQVQAYFTGGTSSKSNQQYGYYLMPVFADTECSMLFKFTKFTGDNYKEQILPHLRDVVYQELYRRKLVIQRKEKGAAPISNFDKNGIKFFFFQELNNYKSVVNYKYITDYYNYLLEKGNLSDSEKDTVRKKIENLTVNGDNCLADFNDVVAAHSLMKNVGAIESTIDAALRDIMNKLTASYINSVGDNMSLLSSLVRDNIIPVDELDKAVERRDNRERKQKITPLKNELNVNLTDLKGNEIAKKPENAPKFNTLEEALTEFCWNHILMQSQIIELSTIDLAFYKFDGGIDFQKRAKELYASGHKLDTNSKYGREFERTIYLTDRINTSRIYTTIKSLFEQAVKNKEITADEMNSILKAFEKVNNTDAQAFRTPSSLRAVLDMQGLWTDEMQQCYESIMSGNWNPANFSVIWQTIKPFTYSIIQKDNGVDGGVMLVPQQHKDSEFLILAAYSMVALATDTNHRLKALCEYMEANQIDLAVYESGVKVGLQNPIDINIDESKLEDIEDSMWAKIEKAAESSLGKKYRSERNKGNFYEGTTRLLASGSITQEQYNSLMDFVEPSEETIKEILNDACHTKDANGNTVENFNTIHVIPYSDYMITTPTPEHWIDTRVVDGSQKRNLEVADLPDDATFVVGDRTFTGAQIKELYNRLYFENIIDNWFDVKENFTSFKPFQNFLVSQVKGNPKFPRDFQNLLSTTEYNGKPDFLVPISYPVIKNRIEELVLAKFKNDITKQKARGGSCILVADVTNALHIVLEDGTYLNTKDKKAVAAAKANNFIKGFECYLPAWTKNIYSNYLVTKTKNGQTWQELDFERLKEEAPELLEMSGIRIPTEDKYSITPLIVKGFLPVQSGSAIMVPSEMTTIVGMDYDVDKMFIRVYNSYVKDGKLHKINYNYNEAPEDQSREARENALLDIELAILRNKEVAKSLFNPGNFDPIKKEGRKNAIYSEFSDNGESLFKIWQDKHGIDNKDIAATLKSIDEASLDELKDFVDEFSKKRNVLSPETYVYNHQQNMTSAGLIGIYANNTTGQAKMQDTNLRLKSVYSFNMEDRLVQSLHDVYSIDKNGIKHRISKTCSYFSAASVDAIKDPALNKIRQNLETAHIACLMMRLGLDVEEIGLLFCQPFVAYFIDTTGKAPTARNLKKQLEWLNEHYKTSVTMQGNEWHTHNFTKNELKKNTVMLTRTKNVRPEDLEGMYSLEEREAIVRNAMLANQLFCHLVRCADDFRGSVRISRADSPNGAIANTFEKANAQKRKVDMYMAKAESDNFTIENVSDIMKNDIANVNDSKAKLRAIFRDPNIKVPRLQIFYTLGIDLAQQLVGKWFVSQSPACQRIVRRIEAETTTLTEDNLATIYKDFTTYLLSGTKRFGDEDTQTLEQKRDYYLYQFPQEFNRILKENPDIASIPGVNMLRVLNGQIVLERSLKMTETSRNAVTAGFDTLLFSQNPVQRKLGIDLFMYAYYNEGLVPRHNSYGQFFSALFLSQFKDANDVLRNSPDDRTMNNFFEQWVAQKDNYVYFSPVPKNNVNIVSGTDAVEITDVNIPRNYSYLLSSSDRGKPCNYITIDEKVYAYNIQESTDKVARYYPIGVIDAGPTERLHKFNAKVSAEDLAKVVVDENRVNNLKKLNTMSYRTAQGRAKGPDVNAIAANIDDAFENIPNVDNFGIDNVFAYEDDKFWNEYDFDSVSDVPEDLEGDNGSSEEAVDNYDENDGQQTLKDNNEDVLCPPKTEIRNGK